MNVIDLAQKMEDKGLNFYKRCKEGSKDIYAKHLFDFLIREESRHKEILTGLAKIVIAVKMIEEDIPLFDETLIEKITDTDLVDQLNTAMKFEAEGIEFYKDAAKREKLEDTKRVLRFLQKQEEKHRRIIMDVGKKVLGIDL